MTQYPSRQNFSTTTTLSRADCWDSLVEGNKDDGGEEEGQWMLALSLLARAIESIPYVLLSVGK